jgi:hypothetical protein
MHFFPILLNFLSITSIQLVHTKEEDNLKAAIQTISDVINTFFIQKNILKFNFLIVDRNNTDLLDIVDGVCGQLMTQKTNSEFQIEIIANQISKSEKRSRTLLFKIPVVILIGENNLRKIQGIYSEYEVISYIKGRENLEITKMSRIRVITTEIVILDTENNIELLTNELFVDGECVTDFIPYENYSKINSFDRNTTKWKSELVFFKKHENFHKSLLIIEGTYSPIESKNEVVKKLKFDLIDMLAQKKNFTQLRTYTGQTEAYDAFLPQSFSTKFIADYMNSIAGISYYSATLPIETDHIFFTVTPGEMYTDYEKLFLPFDEDTWMYMLITFGGAFLFIFIINLTPRLIQNLVYGAHVQTPAFNIVGELNSF